ncbi:MAG: pyridoxal-5'-phosphate-dependent protein subunit beta, partial [Deltaproteobacteria bacterium]|nr:pyridoxal-5'-phosphate-dependent protein subunit beta [Deltaproteobacteria bacterium]
MTKLGLERNIVDQTVYESTIDNIRNAGVVLPTFKQLADPATIPPAIVHRLAGVDPDASDPLNLFRVHWYNG